MRLRTPTGSLVLDRSIRVGDLARGIHAPLVKVNRAIQLSLFALSYYVPDHDVTTRTLLFPRRQRQKRSTERCSKLRLAVIAVAHCIVEGDFLNIMHDFDMRNTVK